MRMMLGILACYLLLAGCSVSSPQRTFIQEGDPARTREEILQRIPLGTPLARADRTLMESGFRRMEFRPTPENQPEPVGALPPVGPPIPPAAPAPEGNASEDASSVSYYTLDAPAGFMVTRAWSVRLYHPAGVVEQIEVTPGGLTGP